MAKVYDIPKLKKFLGEYLELKGIDTRKLMRCFSKEHEDKNPSMGYYEVANICKCFACGEKYDIFKLVGEEYNLDTFKERLKKVDELYNNRELIKNINETIYSKKNTSVELSYRNKGIENSTKVGVYQIKKHEEYIRKCMSNLKDCDYLTNRGISKEVQKKYHIGYDENFKKGEWKAIIIPIYIGSFTARNTDPDAKDKIRKVGADKIFNFWELGEKENIGKTFYIVEGEIDALSLIEVGRKAIGLGSISYIDIFIEKLKANIPQNKFYLMLDNDKRGIKAQRELYVKLKELGIDSISTNILGKCKDPNEYLMKDRLGFINSLNQLENNKWLIKENTLNIAD
ncbi:MULTISPECIES: toprim domain-containing protein [Fusobacterium]|uniref:toprim domain-containing protein n=1 Tax=Fusobacterium TaxID=848 RepID=UPI0025C006DE|nr:toprim domain-containing protein [Fusobacterium sp.]MCI7224332.1 toprim domain-containing protein [Fusobacterium sp.]MDY5305252.1 toprim domain-containing protein [Fusobacterium gastrosuis]MDY5794720.1 toprim domain-containing protein [Fusobacterium gastrosuis]